MKILVLYKRHNMGIDSLNSKHGRMYNVCQGLQAEGHEVHAIVTDYHPTKSEAQPIEAPPFQHTLTPFSFFLFTKYVKAIQQIIEKWKPDIILAGSDALQIIIANIITRGRPKLPFFADLKDNYENFSLTRIPVINSAYKIALKRAQGVVCVSDNLEAYIKTKYSVSNTLVLENFVDEKTFCLLDKNQSRIELGLPTNRFLIGTAGALTKNRGITILPRAFDLAESTHDASTLVVAGHRDRRWRLPRSGPSIDLGFLPPSKVPTLLNALDIGIICNIDSTFGRYCFPQKYNEMLACGLPMIVSRTGIFSQHPHQPGVFSTYYPSNPASLKRAIELAYHQRPQRIHNYDPQIFRQRLTDLSKYLQSSI